MDRRRTRQALLTIAAAGLAAAAASPLPPIRAARWLAFDADVVEAIGREPAECLARVDEPALRSSIAIGRAAFRAPLLLGGQAARAGLSCNACHVNGHGNPRFVFPGLSDTPGTADVTSSLMSASRGDGAFNPKPIPSLYDPPRLASHDRGTRALERFIRGLVVEEFDGEAPPPAVLAGLADYVRALSSACFATKVDVALSGRLEDVRAAAASASAALAANDAATARIMIFAARDGLGQIAERFPAREFGGEAAALRVADLELAAMLPLLATDSAAARERLAAWRAQLAGRLAPLANAEAKSLFDHGRLANWGRGR